MHVPEVEAAMKEMRLLLLLWLAAVLPAPARAAPVTECSKNAFCYCVNTELRGAIASQVAYIRDVIAAQKAKGMAVGYLSIPISTINGSYIGENVKIASEVKERVEKRFGEKAVWLLNTAAKDVALPSNATGADYMLMWTRVLEGEDGLGDLDFVYFVGPSEFARYFGLTGTGDLEKLEAYYDAASKADAGLKKVDKRAFRDYYGLRASVAFSFGSHDEWNIVRVINEKRRAADAATGIAKQMGVFFDGRPVAPGLFEASIAAGDAGACRN
jgi:hypothetical protein